MNNHVRLPGLVGPKSQKYQETCDRKWRDEVQTRWLTMKFASKNSNHFLVDREFFAMTSDLAIVFFINPLGNTQLCWREESKDGLYVLGVHKYPV